MRKSLFALAVLAATTTFTYAATPSTPTAKAAAATKAAKGQDLKAPTLEDIKRAIPEFEGAKSVSSTPVPGLYQVQSDQQIMYITSDLKFALSGRLMDIEKKVDLTEPLLREMAFKKFEADRVAAKLLEKDIARELVKNQPNFIKEVKGNGKDVLYMVTDARCGFCQRMEANLEPLNDITIYRIPVAYLGPDSLRLGDAAWCAKDRVQAWKDISKNAAVAQAGECVAPVEDNTKMVKTWKVQGTPTFFRANGERWAQGLISSEVVSVFARKGEQAALEARDNEFKAAGKSR